MNAVILVSIFAIIHNRLLILKIHSYMVFVRDWYSIYFPVTFFAAIMVSAISFAVVEYRRYRN